MNIIISSTSDNPIYQQIYDQICAQIIKGELPSGFCLPPIRTVAKELRVSVITVKRAWEELERAGFIHAMVGRGCFVAPLTPKLLGSKRNQLVIGKLVKDIEFYRSMGLTKAEFLELIAELYDNPPD